MDIEISNLDKYLLNTNNVLITEDVIYNILSPIKSKYKVTNLNYYIEAMTHKSYIKNYTDNERNTKYLLQNIKNRNIQPDNDSNIIKLMERSYERLEFLGDSVIRLVVAEYLYKRYPSQDEGFLTRLKTKIENGESLAKLTKILGLNKYMLISKHIDINGARTEDDIGILEDIFEAFIGALYLDSNNNIKLCTDLIVHLIETKIDIASLLFYENNYKDLLLKYFHKMKWHEPVYETQEIKEFGDNKKKIFVMCIKDNNNNVIGVGEGTSKKKGEQIAAQKAITKLGYQDNDTSESEVDIITN